MGQSKSTLKRSVETLFIMLMLAAETVWAALLAPVIQPAAGKVSSPFTVTVVHSNNGGTIFYTWDGSDPVDEFGYPRQTSRSYSGPFSLNKSALVKARVKSGTEWSPLSAVPFSADQDFSRLIFTELMFHPMGAGGDGPEFLELKNTGFKPLDMTGLQMYDGNLKILYNFDLGALMQPGQIAVFALSPNQFKEIYPEVPIFGTLNRDLDNFQSLISVKRGMARAVTAFYGTHAPWQVVPDNHGYFTTLTNQPPVGFSLVPQSYNLHADPEHFSSWRASSFRFGSPGADDPPSPLLPVYINEVLARPGPNFKDSVELYNPNSADVNLGGWWLSDERNGPFRYKIPAGTIIKANDYLVFDETAFNQGTNGFTFSAEGDRCYLFSGDVNGELTGFSHGVEFPASERDISFSRIVNSEGDEFFLPQSILTLGQKNSPPKMGPLVISEVAYQPGSDEVDFIELQNIGPAPLPLWDAARPDYTWALGRIHFGGVLIWMPFPTNTIVPPNGMLVLANGDVSQFRQRHGIPASVTILPLNVKLDDTEGELTLIKPSGVADGAARHVVADTLKYKNRAPWPVLAAGGGHSIERKELTAHANEPNNWRATPGGSSPGRNTHFNTPAQAKALGSRIAFVNRPVNLTGLILDDEWPGRQPYSSWTVPGAYLAQGEQHTFTNEIFAPFSRLGTYQARFLAGDTEFLDEAQIEIQVIERPYDKWLESFFTVAQLQNIALLAETADPDQDGLTNIEEYFFSFNPVLATTGPEPVKAVVVGNAFQVSWIQLSEAPDVEIKVELAHQLDGPWFSGPGLFEVAQTALKSGLKQIVLTSTTRLPNSSQQYLRLSLLPY